MSRILKKSGVGGGSEQLDAKKVINYNQPYDRLNILLMRHKIAPGVCVCNALITFSN